MLMRRIKLLEALMKARIFRLVLWVNCAIKAISLGLPLRLASFPLLPFLHWQPSEENPKNESCEAHLATSIDVIVSLYQFEKHVEVIKKSVQSCFLNPNVTFHFVLVSGSESELNWLRSLIQSTHHKIHVTDGRIGIYEAWNLAIKHGSGDFITNLNADDFRLPHSICGQAAALQKSSADGCFGNFVFSQDIQKSIHEPASSFLVSNLGSFDLDTLLNKSQNFMHCAPMWRRSLHNRFGYFDESLKSSGDTEFWLRCLDSGASFSLYKPETVIYFHNPEGLSTSLGSTGRKEWGRIRDLHLSRQNSSNF